jgi:hypothetical protein
LKAHGLLLARIAVELNKRKVARGCKCALAQPGKASARFDAVL